MPKQQCPPKGLTCSQCVAFSQCKPMKEPKPYLNREEQEVLFILGACVASAEEAYNQIRKRRNSPGNMKLLRCLRIAARLLEMAINLLSAHIPDEVFNQYLRRLNTTKKIEVREG